MPKLTKKRDQDKGRAAAEPEQSAVDAGGVEEDEQHRIPVGASLYWEIPGDIPGKSRRCVPLPAELDLPKMPSTTEAQTKPAHTEAVNSNQQFPNVSVHRKARANTSDTKALIPVPEKNNTELPADASDKSSANPSYALPLEVEADSHKTSTTPPVPPTAPDIPVKLNFETSAEAVKTNQPASSPLAQASSAETPRQNTQEPPAHTSASDEAKSSTPEKADVSEPSKDKNDLHSRQGAEKDIQPDRAQPLDTVSRAPLSDSKPSSEVSPQNIPIKPNTDYLQVANYQHTQSGEKTKKTYVIPSLLALLLLLLLGGKGYDYLVNNTEKREVVTTQTETQETLIPTPEPVAANAQVKVVEITVDKLDQYALSGIRMITHVVVRGDTLWDIAEAYLNNPWRYPELAERSKIKNPDLIYPGDIVHIHIKIAEQEST